MSVIPHLKSIITVSSSRILIVANVDLNTVEAAYCDRSGTVYFICYRLYFQLNAEMLFQLSITLLQINLSMLIESSAVADCDSSPRAMSYSDCSLPKTYVAEVIKLTCKNSCLYFFGNV